MPAARWWPTAAAPIATSGGFLALWRRELQAALPVLLWTSSLLQSAEHSGRRCGVITIETASLIHSLTTAHLQAAGADPATPVEGITPCSAQHSTLLQGLTELDEADAQAQVLAAASRLRTRHPKVDTLVLECTNLPSHADALRHVTGLAVLDVVALLNLRKERLCR